MAARHADVYLTWGEPPGAGGPPRSTGCGRLPPSSGAHRPVRHPPARDQPRHLRAGLGRATRCSPSSPTRRIAQSPGRRCSEYESEGQRGCSRCTAVAEGLESLPEPVGRSRPGPRRCGHRAGGQPPRGGGTDRREPLARHRRVHPLRATRIWRRRTGSARGAGIKNCGAKMVTCT